MECKLYLYYLCQKLNVELIDTLWNVNDGLPAGNYSIKMELIDTLWNVNYSDKVGRVVEITN